MHLSFKNLNPTPTKKILSKFQNLYIFTYELSIECVFTYEISSILFFFVFFFQVYACVFVYNSFD